MNDDWPLCECQQQFNISFWRWQLLKYSSAVYITIVLLTKDHKQLPIGSVLIRTDVDSGVFEMCWIDFKVAHKMPRNVARVERKLCCYRARRIVVVNIIVRRAERQRWYPARRIVPDDGFSPRAAPIPDLVSGDNGAVSRFNNQSRIGTWCDVKHCYLQNV